MATIARPDVAEAVQRIHEYVQEHRYSRHSWTKFVLSGGAARAGLKAWAIQKYHQTYLQNRIFSAVHSNAESEDIRQFMVQQLIDEETPISSGSDAHYNLMKRFAIAMGATDAEARQTPIAPPIQHYIDYILNVARVEHPVFALLVFYAGESQAPEVARLVCEQFRKQFGATDHDLEWFIVHAGDQEHADHERELVERHAAGFPDLYEHGLSLVSKFTQEWNTMQDYYYYLVSTESARGD